MNKKTKIYFIGRKQGIGLRRYRLSHLENRRRYETEGLIDASKKIQQIRLIKNADVIWVRVRPEFTTDRQRDKIETRLKSLRKKIPIINDISVFDNYDCKDATFGLWKKNGIKCPNYLTIKPKKTEQNLIQTLDEISSFIKKYKKIFLRTNNETASLGIFTLTSKSNQSEIKESLLSLIERCKKHQVKRKSTRIIAVEFIEPQNKNGNQDLYRAHVLFGKVISFYAVTSKKAVFHNIDMTIENLDRFIKLNEKFKNKINIFEPEIIKATEALGCNLGAIEFFLVNDKPIYIELNPMWGGHASKFGFGDQSFQNYLLNNRNNLEGKIPNIYYFMDSKSYYKNLFEFIHEHISHSTGS